MTFAQLLDFITNPKLMQMSHTYQPVLIRTLVDAGGTATIRQLAHAFLGHDEYALGEYEKTIKAMPLKVLTKHGVVRHDGQLVSITVDHLTFKQQTQLRLACEQRLQDFLQKRDLSV